MELLDERDVVVIGRLRERKHGEVVRFEPRADVVEIALRREQAPFADDLRQTMQEDRRDETALRAEVVLDGRVVGRTGLSRDLSQRDPVDAVHREQSLCGHHESATRSPKSRLGRSS